MVRRVLAVVLAAGLVVGGVLAAEGVVVKYDKEKSELTLKIDGKEKKVKFEKGHPHLHGEDGKLIKTKDFEKHLKKGVKLDVEEEGGKITELTIKKKEG
jgi:hypothetical protein